MVRRVRLLTGLVLFAYVATHLLNHAVGLISLATLEEARLWFLALWRFPPVSVLLAASLLAHFALALTAMYQRRRLSLTAAEAVQLVLGIAIPPLLAGHVVGTRGAQLLFGITDSYTYVLLVHWVSARENLVLQTAALLATWIHGCIGIHYWLRLKPVYPHISPILYASAIVLPLLALLGYWVAGREVMALAKDPDWLRAAVAAINAPAPTEISTLYDIRNAVFVLLVVAIFGVMASRLARTLWERRRGVVRVTYGDGRVVALPTGWSILETSREAGIPHASVCGGRGRCSTCRVRVTRGLESLPEPGAEELRVLHRVGAGPGVRLACQTRPTADIGVMPLLPAGQATVANAYGRPEHLAGSEREIAILFADLRAFTQFSEQKLPYDVVFVLNRYFAGMGAAVEEAGGHLDKFIGDGVMALFGVTSSPPEACRQALTAARLMAIKLAEMNRALHAELPTPLRIGIGIHVGPAIIGEMGYGKTVGLTAVGDSVNTASRLESLTKEYGAELVISEDVAILAGMDLGAYPSHQITIRGRREPITVRVIAAAAELPV